LKTEEIVFKAMLGLIAASIGINSYFVKLKVEEISSDLRALSENYYTLRVENASRDALLNGIRIRMEILESKADKIEERVRATEKARH